MVLYCYYKHYTSKRFAVTNSLDSITGHYYIIMSDFNINFLNRHNIPKALTITNLVNWLKNNAVVLMNMDQIIRFNGRGSGSLLYLTISLRFQSAGSFGSDGLRSLSHLHSTGYQRQRGLEGPLDTVKSGRCWVGDDLFQLSCL